MRSKTLDLTGNKYGLITVLRKSDKPSSHTSWVCSCSCSRILTIRGTRLISGQQSCGCLKLKHGQAGKHQTRTYRSWRGMKDRCTNPANRHYINTSYDPRWENFTEFAKDIGEAPQGKSLDRLCPFGNYCRENCQYGRHSIKIGGLYQQTFLREHDPIGLINATSNSPCVDANGNSLPGFTDPSQCAAAGAVSNDPSVGGSFTSILLPYDLTRGGTKYNYFGHTDVKETGLYVQDQIKAGQWLFRVGIRGDLYNGLTVARQAEPRLGASYSVKKTGTVLRVSYARTLPSPFNKNLVLSSQGLHESGCIADHQLPRRIERSHSGIPQ